MTHPPIETVDYPHVRAHVRCPLCNQPKQPDLVTCWGCYRQWDGRNGFHADALETIEACEREWAEQPSLPGAEQVRDAEIPTPQLDYTPPPFSLTSETATRDEHQPSLFPGVK